MMDIQESAAKTAEKYGEYLVSVIKDAGYWNGDKFPGSIGATPEWEYVDYWTLRRRSLDLFRKNIYAKGIIRRLLWNEIHTGLVATPTPVAPEIWRGGDEMESAERGVEAAARISSAFDLYSSTPATTFESIRTNDLGRSRSERLKLLCKPSRMSASISATPRLSKPIVSLLPSARRTPRGTPFRRPSARPP